MTTYVKKKEKKQMPQAFFVIEFLLCALMVLCITGKVGSLASASFTGSFLLLVAWFFKLVLLDGRNRHLAMAFVIVCFSTVCVVVSAMLNDEAMTMAYFTEHLVFLSTILFLFVIMNTQVDRVTCRVVLMISVVISYIYPIAYRLFPQDRRFGLLDLNFSNPNLASMWLLQAVMYGVIAFFLLDSRIWRVLALLPVPINIGLMIQTDSRNSLIALVAFGLLCVWAIFKQRTQVSNLVVLGFNLAPIAFVPIYMAYVDVVMKAGWFSFLVKDGKSLDSRVFIWENSFEAIEGVWLIGNYAGVGGNTHNSHMVLLSSYGVIGLVLGICFLYAICAEVNAQSKSRKNLYPIIAFFAVLFMGLGEGSLFSGGVGIFIPACGFLLLAKCDYGVDEVKPFPWQRKSKEKK